jgi:hypothetical protein
MATTFTSGQFADDPGGVHRAAENGLVIITEAGQPAYVMMKFEAYERLFHGAAQTPLIQFLESLDLRDLDVSRQLDTGREIELE